LARRLWCSLMVLARESRSRRTWVGWSQRVMGSAMGSLLEGQENTQWGVRPPARAGPHEPVRGSRCWLHEFFSASAISCSVTNRLSVKRASRLLIIVLTHPNP